MKMHLNFAASNLDKSVRFYATLLESTPVKHFDDYALFVTETPGLELALDRDAEFTGSHGAHFGIAVDSVESVERAIERFEAAGFETRIEREETCCYANQTKVWTRDPDGRRWEVYTVHEEMEIARGACCSA